jgi:hypothetical protein
MMTRAVPLAAVVGASGLLLAPPAAAKFGLSIATEPSRPVARSGARVIVRTDIDVPRKHGIRLTAVGPWRRKLGQAVIEIRLVWTGPRTLTGRVRFPYAGRWHLDVPASAASPPAWLFVRVRSRA